MNNCRIISYHASLLTRASLLTIILASTGAYPAYAQSGGEDQTGAMETVLVTGIRASISQAIDTKRKSDVILDAISAEDIGKLPDQNISETLSRIPGVQINRVEGEGTAVNVRGIDLNRLQLNDKAFIGSSVNGDPATSDLSPELLSSVEIIKSPSADLTEGWLGAVVNLRTKRPLDFDHPVYSVRVQGEYGDKAQHVDGKASAFAAAQFFGDKLGVLIGASGSLLHGRTDEFSTGGWMQVANAAAVGGVTYDGTATATRLFRPNRMQAWIINRYDSRWAVNGTLQFHPMDELMVTLDGFASKKDVDRTRIAEQVILNNNYTGARAMPDGTIYTGNVAGVTLRPLIYEGNSFASATAWNLDINYHPSNWELHTSVSQSGGRGGGADGNNPTNPGYAGADGVYVARQVAGDVANVSYNTNNGAFAPDYQVSTNFNKFDPSQYEIYAIVDNVNTTSNYGRDYDVDVAYSFGENLLRRVKAGYRREELSLTTGGGSVNSSLFGACTPATNLFCKVSGSTSYPRANQILGLSYGPLANGFFAGEDGAYPRTLLGGTIDIDAARQFLGYTLTQPASFMQGFSAVKQSTDAAYGRLDFGTELGNWEISGNGGVRYVHTERTSSGFAYNTSTATLTPVSGTKTFDDFLPSFNLVAKPRDDLFLRFAAAKVLARPPLSQTGVGISLNPVSNTGSAGNPDLDPYKATQIDASAEWYFSPASMISVAFFKKWVSAFTTIVQVTENHPEAPNNTTFSTVYLINRPFNGSDGEVHGFEVNYQQAFDFLPDPFDGFGIQTSYTFSPSSSPNIDELTGLKLPMQNSSRNSYNLIVYYEKDDITARVAYNHRDGALLVQQAASVGGSEFATGRGQLDLSLTYRLNDIFKLDFQAINIGGNLKENYIGTRNRVFNTWQDDCRIYMGVAATF
jgi:iron complex outermembrane recepter protein